MKTKLIVCDLDGVILNSRENMKVSWNIVKKKFNLNVNFENYFMKIGKPFQSILKDLNIRTNNELIEKTYHNASIEYEENIKFYSGAIETLKILEKKNILLAICTSKNFERTNRILEKIKINFNSINCPSPDLKGKPYPDQLINAVNHANVNLNQTIYIGDTVIDMQTAKNAEVEFIYASYGYGNIINSNKSISKFNQILKFI